MPDAPESVSPALERVRDYVWMSFQLIYVAVSLIGLLLGWFEFHTPEMRQVFTAAVVLFALSSLGVWRMSRKSHTAYVVRASWAFLTLDLVALGIMVYASGHLGDPFYVLFLGLVFFYASIIQRRSAWKVGLGIGTVYLFGHVAHWVTHGAVQENLVFMTTKAMAIPLVGLFIGTWTEQRLEREQAFRESRDEVRSLNDELTRRLAELHVVTEITEIIHSTLDFDSIGPLVLDSLKKAIDMPTCSLMVVDRSTEATVFNASSGMDEGGMETLLPAYPLAENVLDETLEDEVMFTCTNIVEHNDMAAVFCCPADRLDALTDDDMLVLQAVSSELVVAVENAQLYQLTKRLSITDELTGLKNYRFFQQRLDQEYERANRYNRYLSLLMIDVDHFKDFNDAHGHVAGDRGLADLATILSSCVREVDIVTRYGGEEFTVILPETDAAGAFVVAEKIREAVALFDFADPDGNRTARMTVSVGVATFPVHSLDREGLLRQADDALYQAKHFGRDRVRAPRITSETPES